MKKENYLPAGAKHRQVNYSRGIGCANPPLSLPNIDPTERVAIFIDGSNLYHGLKNASRPTQIDFGKLCNFLCNGRRLTRIYYYNAPIKAQADLSRYKQQQSFFEQIKKVPYLELKLGRLEIRKGVPVEKGVDVLLVVDMIRYARNNAYDTAILVSGDGDFAPALEVLKEYGKHIENAYFKSGRSYHLANHSDRFIDLDELPWDQIALKKE